MRDCWFADNRDLVKWGVLIRLAGIFEARRILQVAYWRPSQFPRIVIDGDEQELPLTVLGHFRNLRSIMSMPRAVKIAIFCPLFDDRAVYLGALLRSIAAHAAEKTIVFLDPDTGLQPQGNATLDHVLDSEVREIWGAMKSGDILALYQHQTNRNGQPWIEVKQQQLAQAIGVEMTQVKVASGPEIAQDVVFFYLAKP
jgi:hypothetical protein